MKRVLFDSDIFSNGNFEEAKGEFEDPENCFDDVCQLANDWTYDDYLWFIEDFHKYVPKIGRYYTWHVLDESDYFISRKIDYFTWYGDFYKDAHKTGYQLYAPRNAFNGWWQSLEDSFSDDWYDIKLEDENGHLFYTQADHDGTIYQELRVLTDAGYDLLERWYEDEGRLTHLSEWEIFDKVWNSSHYSHLPHLADRIFGAQSIEGYKMAA